MKLRFQQSGGFAGLVRGCELLVADLPPHLSSLVKELVKTGSAEPAAGGPMRDGLMFELWIEAPSKKVTMTMPDTAIPPRLTPLLEYLKMQSRPQAPI